MGITRKPFQGVANIVRFNWPFYALTTVAIIGLLVTASVAGGAFQAVLTLAACAVFLPAILSLLVSFYVYDLSGHYSLAWMDDIHLLPLKRIININAGFDETSALLQQKYAAPALSAFDFYDAAKHTEPSIRRARKAYPAYPGTQTISTNHIPCEEDSVDAVFLLFAAHEIREDAERTVFFKELQRVLTPGGKIVVAEHLRDVPNFLAYNIGFLHFLSRSLWLKTFRAAGLRVESLKKHTPFVTIFILTKNDGAAS